MKKIISLFLAPAFLVASSITGNESDYLSICKAASSNSAHFKQFRSNRAIYRVIEGVPRHIGEHCIKRIPKEYLSQLSKLDHYECIGQPKRFNYPNVGSFSPCTLRYVMILADLKKRFGSLNTMNIAEIGGGYGGLCAVMKTFENYKSYTLIDLPPVLKLAETFLNKLKITNTHFISALDLQHLKSYDLLISNYAFSEIDAEHQLEYLDKLIKHVPRGYMVLNFISQSKKILSLSRKKVKEHLENAGHQVTISPEIPQTNPRKPNVLLTWGNQLD